MNNAMSVGLSFDDVLLVPARSSILPGEVDLRARLTRDVELNIPVLSAAMDTVTEDRLAIALAREGGMGVIHRNCTMEEQVLMVRRVKRSENTVIEHPAFVRPETTIDELRRYMGETGVSGFPVVDDENVLQGIVTRRDTWIIEEGGRKVKEVMTPRDKLVTARIECTHEEAKAILYLHRIEKLPLVDDRGRLVGLMTSADIEKRMRFQNACKDPIGHLRVGAAIGVCEDSVDRAIALIETGCDALFIDAATGHTDRVIRLLENLKSRLSDVPVVAGNVVTAEGASDLIQAGAAAIKVGVGPGSICTTRVIAGVGMPQFTAIQDVSTVCREKNIPLIADGGIRYSGDITKALAGGADCVMIGSLLAGTEESPGDTVLWQGRTFKEYRGMGSLGAMQDGCSDRYGQRSSGKLVPEGVEARVPHKGRLTDMIFQLMGGLRSGMGYVGCKTTQKLRENACFVRITSSGLRESHPHDILITEEPINYSPM